MLLGFMSLDEVIQGEAMATEEKRCQGRVRDHPYRRLRRSDVCHRVKTRRLWYPKRRLKNVFWSWLQCHILLRC